MKWFPCEDGRRQRTWERCDGEEVGEDNRSVVKICTKNSAESMKRALFSWHKMNWMMRQPRAAASVPTNAPQNSQCYKGQQCKRFQNELDALMGMEVPTKGPDVSTGSRSPLNRLIFPQICTSQLFVFYASQVPYPSTCHCYCPLTGYWVGWILILSQKYSFF